MKRLLNGGRESFLVVEDFGSGFVTTRAKTRVKNKEVIIAQTDFVENLSEIKKPLFPVDKLILAMDSGKAFTVESLVHLKRNEPEEPIKETELDTLVFRGLWEFLNRYRGPASKKLGCSDLDLVLAAAEIREVFLGSYKVFNPLGFKGEELSLRYRGTFISREEKQSFERMEAWAREKIIVETGAILALSAPKASEYSAFIRDKNTEIFIHNEEEQLHLKDVSWGSGRILKKIGLLFGVDDETALDVLLFLNGKSPAGKVKTAVERKVKEEAGGLTKLLPKISGRSRKSICLFSDLPLSLFKKFFGGTVEFVDFREILTEQGYDVIINKENEEFLNVGDTLTLVTHVYFPPQYKFLNDLLARRARWLTVRP
jgi:hypothetical protein